jgi:DNA helicase II / ATP-dependent DNA helicase PcrA
MVVTWAAETIQRLHAEGLPYRSSAVLVRSRATFPRLLEAFDAHHVPVQPAGRTGLFARPEAQMFGKTYNWLVDHRWSSEPYAWGEVPTDDEVFDGYRDLYSLEDLQDKHVRERLLALKASVPSEDRPVSLVADFYELLGDLGVAGWDADDPMTSARLGTLARCSSILADYEAVRRRSRPHPEEAGAQTGGQDRGNWYYMNLAIYIARLRQGRLRGLRRRAQRAGRRGRPDHAPQGQGPGVGRGVRALADHQPLPVVADRAAPRLAGPAAPVQPAAVRGC